MIVVDTNIIVYAHIESDHTTLAQSALKIDPDWIAPSLWISEFRNVLSLHIRRSQLRLEEALRAIQTAERVVNLAVYEDSKDILSLAQSSGCTAYDCEFVAAAKTLGVPLVTMDSQVLKAFPETAISLVDFATPPPETESEIGDNPK